MEEDDARAQGLFAVIGTEFDDRYVVQLKKQSIHPEIIAEQVLLVLLPQVKLRK